MISCTHPKTLFLLLLIIPSVSYTLFFVRKITRSLGVLYGEDTSSLRKYITLKRSLYARTLCFVFSWTCLVFALSGPVWGTSSVPVQKTGTAVSFVFDISYSMTAQDAFPQSTMTRLSASSQFASLLLNRFYTDSQTRPAVSIIIAKGDGVLALPFSEDFYSASSYFSSLSPSLMTSPGSNLGGGVRCAIRSFPSNHARYSSILLFTDGDETKSSLEEAADEALKYGINVIIIGFGSVQGSHVLTGDGESYIETKLQDDKISAMITRLRSKYPLHTNAVHYVRASEPGAASKILSIVKPSAGNENQQYLISYEVQPIKRHPLFLVLSLLFFVSGILFSDFHYGMKKIAAGIIIVPLFFSCSVSFKDGAELLQGSFYWHQGRYQNATASFLHIIEKAREENNEDLLQYGYYNLAVTYMKQQEYGSALQKLMLLQDKAPPHVLFSSYYNSGIIEYEKENFKAASLYFKEALRIQPESIDAKINLELSNMHVEAEQRASSMTISPLSESKRSSGIQDTIFSIIRENEQNRWRNQQMNNTSEGGLDH